MKIKTIAATAVLFVMSSAAFAQKNDAEFQQIGGDANMAMISQVGLMNNVFISQKASNDEATIQ